MGDDEFGYPHAPRFAWFAAPQGGCLTLGRLGGEALRPVLRRSGWRQRAAQDQLLHVAARQRARRGVQPAAAHVKALRHVRGVGARGAAAHPAQRVGEVRAADAFGHGVFPHGQVAHHADTGPVFRDAGNAARGQPGGVGLDRLAQHARLPLRGHAQARQQLRQSHLPIARHPGDGDDLARAQSQRYAAQPFARAARGVHVNQFGHHVANRCGGLAGPPRHGVAHHPFGQLAFGGVGGGAFGHQAAGAQHGHAVRHAQHLAQLVADEDDGQALRHHLAQGVEQRLALLRGEHGGGLVQDQDACAAVQRFQNLDALAFTHRQIAHARRRVHRQAELLPDRYQLFARSGAARERLRQRFAAQHHVVQHAEVVGQREVLVHHANARGQRGARVARRQRRAKGFDVARVGHVVAKQDRHQGGFARPVLAQQRQHFAARQLQADVVVGQQRAKALGDARQAQHRGGAARIRRRGDGVSAHARFAINKVAASAGCAGARGRFGLKQPHRTATPGGAHCTFWRTAGCVTWPWTWAGCRPP